MYVLSAVRTPIALMNGLLCELSAGHLSAIVFREALERAIVPVEDVEHLFMGCVFNSNFEKEMFKRISFPKSGKIFTSKCNLECFVKACEFMKKYNTQISMAGGVESTSNSALFNEQGFLEAVIKNCMKNNIEETFFNFTSNQPQSYKKYIAAYKNNSFCDEIVKINFRKKGYQINVAEDEPIKSSEINEKTESYSKNLLFPGDGAAAAVIASEEYVKKNHLMPLVEVVSCASETINGGEYFSVMSQTIKKALDAACLNSQSISMWEIIAFNQTLISSSVNQLKIDPSLINKDGDIFCLGLPVGMYGGKMISHVIHSLSPGQFGCAAGLSIGGTASAVVLKKLYNKTSGKPQLTLHMKKMCPLCDDLGKQLEPFKNRFSLQKIDIELKGNEKLKNLYRYEIPVLFLDGTFLCKHKLDSEHFDRRLRQSEVVRRNNNNFN